MDDREELLRTIRVLRDSFNSQIDAVIRRVEQGIFIKQKK